MDPVHLGNGKWVLDNIPGYLRKCKEGFRKMTSTNHSLERDGSTFATETRFLRQPTNLYKPAIGKKSQKTFTGSSAFFTPSTSGQFLLILGPHSAHSAASGKRFLPFSLSCPCLGSVTCSHILPMPWN